ncbi:YqiJ family protein [Hirschia maritima]|uniref:YqiJ family protein n=1 Tax=Hirschia maritima TaxID=1121961 RepID=UPI000362C08C|nr:YqiJ family protein [Hirschia maritima]
MIFFDAALAPFTIALLIMLFIAVLEVIGLLMGFGFSEFVDGFLPDIELDADLDIDADAGLETPSASPLDVDPAAGPDVPSLGLFGSFLAWLCVGKVPVLVLFVAFLTSFGLAGIVTQNTVHSITGMYLPVFIPVLIALVISLPLTRHIGLFLARVMPKEETDAVSKTSFIGKVATIFRGKASLGQPAEAKLEDHTGQVHYLLVEPDEADSSFEAGDEVLLVEQKGPIFKVIANNHKTLN